MFENISAFLSWLFKTGGFVILWIVIAHAMWWFVHFYREDGYSDEDEFYIPEYASEGKARVAVEQAEEERLAAIKEAEQRRKNKSRMDWIKTRITEGLQRIIYFLFVD